MCTPWSLQILRITLCTIPSIHTFYAYQAFYSFNIFSLILGWKLIFFVQWKEYYNHCLKLRFGMENIIHKFPITMLLAKLGNNKFSDNKQLSEALTNARIKLTFALRYTHPQYADYFIIYVYSKYQIYTNIGLHKKYTSSINKGFSFNMLRF